MIGDAIEDANACQSTAGCPQYILPITPSISVTPVPPYAAMGESISVIPVSPCNRRTSVLCQADLWWLWCEMDFHAITDSYGR
jgi:hypothetical protein